MPRQDRKKDDDQAAARGLGRWCDARAVCWSLVIPIAILLVLLLRSRTSRWGLGTQSERALRFDRAFRPSADPPDTDPTFDPEGEAERIRQETAAKAQAQLDKAQRKLERTKGSKWGKQAADGGDSGAQRPGTKGAGAPRGGGGAKKKRQASKDVSGGAADADAAGAVQTDEEVRSDQSSPRSTAVAEGTQQQQEQQQDSHSGGEASSEEEASGQDAGPEESSGAGSGGGGGSGDQGGSGDSSGDQGGSGQSAEELAQTAMMSVQTEKKARPQRRRKTDVRFLVVPAHKCQLLDDPLANACMYGGLEEASRPECTEATKGQTSNSYLPAFTRVQPHVSGFGLRRYSVAPVWDGSSEEAKTAWKETVGAADVLIIDELAILYLGGMIHGKKLIALQHDAAASMRTCWKGTCAQQLLKQPRVLAYLQHTSLVPLSHNNAPRVKDIVHFDLMDSLHKKQRPADEVKLSPNTARKKPAFTDQMLSKVYTIIPMIWRWRFPITCRGRPEFTEWMMKALQGGVGDFPPYLRPIHERPVDLAFYGALTPGASWRKGQATADELFRLHRQQLFEALTKLGRDCPEISVVAAESVDYETFAQGLRNAKIFISPLGKAEASGKDYEAIISRGVLLKPLAASLKSYPNIYEPEVTCVEIKADYSDLEEVVKGLLGDPVRMQRIADTAYQRLLAHSQEKTVAQDIAETMMDIVEADDPGSIVYID